MNLGEIRAAVRAQTMTLQDELPNPTIDEYVQQGFERTIAMENLWPFYEKTWFVTLPAGQSNATAPADVNWPALQAVTDTENSYRLRMVDPTTAEEWFGWNLGPTPGSPSHFTVWGGDIYFYPQPSYDDDRVFYLRGYRLASDWMTGADGDVPDCDPRLHRSFINYAIALAYAQQEDLALEDRYMVRWQRDADAARMAIMEPVRHRPMTVGVRPQTPIGPGRYTSVASWRINTP